LPFLPAGIYELNITVTDTYDQYNNHCDSELDCVGDFEDLLGTYTED